MFIGVILCNLIVVLLAFCGVVNVYNCLTSMEQEMGVDVFMVNFVPACTPLFMAACLFMLVQIACQIQRMNIELKMQRGSDGPSASSSAAARAQSRKPNRAAPDAEAARDYFSLEDERKPSRASRSPRPAGHGTRPLKTPPAQPSLDAWSGSSERFGASSSVLPARAAAVAAAAPASAAPLAEPSASPAAATAASASTAAAPASSPEDWPAASAPEARGAASSSEARPAAQTPAPSKAEATASDGKDGAATSGSRASRTKSGSAPSFFSLD